MFKFSDMQIRVVILLQVHFIVCMSVRVAERSKASDLRSDPHMWAWVRIPFLTIFCFTEIKQVRTYIVIARIDKD